MKRKQIIVVDANLKAPAEWDPKKIRDAVAIIVCLVALVYVESISVWFVKGWNDLTSFFS